MCGIAGLFSKGIITDFEKQNQLVDTYISDRGPDYSGLAAFNIAGKMSAVPSHDTIGIFWHKRLSIIDVSADGNQPMQDNFGNTIIFNGEIYNYLEIKKVLIGFGEQFRSHSDTEVVLAAYRKWGVACFDKFIGMFAIALHDQKENILLLARDSMGIKPLYYCKNEESICFSSRADLTAAMAGLSAVNLAAAFNYIQFGITDNDNQTMYQNILSLLPGEVHIYSLHNYQQTSSFFIDYAKAAFDTGILKTENEKKEALKYVLTNTLKLHTRTDVGFCTTLSGGLDSSAIIGILKSTGINELNPFSYIPEDEAISEEKWIDMMAAANHLSVHKITYNSNDFWNDFPDFISTCDLPVNTASMYSQYKIYQAIASSGNKVVLDGQGGDEMFGGYIQYLYYKAYENLVQLKPATFLSVLKGSKQTVSSAFLYRNLLRLSFFNIAPSVYNKLRLARKDSIVNKEFFKTANAFQSVNYESDTLKGRILNDLKLQDLPRLLRYADRSSMRWSLESRVPFASQPVMAFMEKMESDDFVSKDGVTKSLFRSVIKDFIPEAIYNRRDKKGFNTNYKHILYSKEMIDFFEAIPQDRLPILNKQNMLNALKQNTPYDSNKLWRLAFFAAWCFIKTTHI